MLKIKNAMICDGSGSAPFQGDILVENGRILAVGGLSDAPAQTVINADGMIATPGFVDVHRHLDFNALTNPRFGELEMAQGITTAVGGNCGLAPYPCRKEVQQEIYDFIQPCLGKCENGAVYDNVGSFLSAVDAANPYINVGTLAATGAVKACVKGFSKTPFTAKEMDTAQHLLCDALDQGALGISCGIMYTPECYSTTQEYIQLLSAAAKYGRVLTSHIRGEGDGLVASVKEVIDIAKRAGLPLNISHFKSVGKKNWQREIFKAIELIETERAAGNPVTADFYPYIGGSTTLLTLLPPTFVCDTTAQTLAKLETACGVAELEREIYKTHSQWDNMVLDIGWDRIVISGVTLDKNKGYQGKSIAAICSEHHFVSPVSFVAALLAEEKGQVSIIVMSMCEEDLDTVAKLPYTALISDSLYGAMENPHPRLFSSFSKMLRSYVYERKILTLQEAVHKMSGMPAARFSMPQKGILRCGADADINLFRLENIRDNADFEHSAILATGFDTVIVHGGIAAQKNILQARHGSVVKAQ